jgi:hypothetical protein
VLGVEALFARDRIETARQCGAGFGDALPAFPRLGRFGGLLGGIGRSAARQGHHLVVGADGIARGIRVVGRPFPAGALAQNASEAQENEHCERQEDNGVNIEHVSHAPEAAIVAEAPRFRCATPARLSAIM